MVHTLAQRTCAVAMDETNFPLPPLNGLVQCRAHTVKAQPYPIFVAETRGVAHKRTEMQIHCLNSRHDTKVENAGNIHLKLAWV